MMARVHPHNLFATSGRASARVRFLYGFLCALVALTISGCAGIAANNQPNPSPTAQLLVVPNSVDFKTVVVGQPNTQTLQLSNTGKTDLTISHIKISGSGLKLKFVAMPLVLESGQKQNITVVFDPSALGHIAGNLSFTSNDRDPIVNIPIAGQGENAFAQLQASPGSVSFGNLSLQTTSTKDVTLSNTGDVVVTIKGVTVSGSGFGVSDLTPGFSLAPQQQVTFKVWFKPHAKGPASAKLSIISSNLSSPLTLPLTADGSPTTTPPPSSHSVKLTWEPSPSAKNGYEVYRGEVSGGPYNRINSSMVGDPSYVDAAVNSASTYYYVVTAVNHGGHESNFSNEVAIAIPPQ
jgi:hypothetical protein